MAVLVACALEIPRLAEAARARGLRIVPMPPDGPPGPDAAAAVIGCGGDPAVSVGRLRAHAWHGAVMLVLPERGCVSRALDAGADDAAARPVEAAEIAARLAARLRSRPAPPIAVGALSIDPVERRVSRAGRPIALLPREYALLLHLARRPGRCVSRAELLEAVWGLGFDPGTNVVEVHVSRLRAKLDRGFPVALIETEKGRGYRLRA